MSAQVLTPGRAASLRSGFRGASIPCGHDPVAISTPQLDLRSAAARSWRQSVSSRWSDASVLVHSLRPGRSGPGLSAPGRPQPLRVRVHAEVKGPTLEDKEDAKSVATAPSEPDAEMVASNPNAPSGGGASEQAKEQPAVSLSLEDVNPVDLGRRSRQFLDDVWRRILELGQPARPQVALDEDEEEALIQGPNCEWVIPNAQFTKVLVVGATGRVGRVLVRKLLLRGYSVRVLVRSADFQTMEQLPGAAEVMEADLEGPVSAATIRQAVSGCQKIIYCATARNATLEALAAVDEGGVVSLAKALMDYNHHMAQRRAGRSSKSKAVVVKFNKERYQQGWKLREGKVPVPGGAASAPRQQGLSGAAGVDAVTELAADAEFEITGDGHGLFSGYVVERGAYVEVKRVVEMPEGLSLGRFEGLVVRVIGDGRPYSMVLEVEGGPQPQQGLNGSSSNSRNGSAAGAWDGTADWALMEDEDEGFGGAVKPKAKGRAGASVANGSAATSETPGGASQYVARFNTRRGPSTIRIPFSAFRPSALGQPPLDPAAVTSMAFRFEQKRPRSQPAVGDGASDPYSFRLELDFIKAFPGGDETDFILVSCTGAAVPEDDRPAVLRAKLAAESQLRNSGLGYTIVRPGPLFEEPGGQKALVFDQGNRISQGISCADVADVCVKALHDPLARNKSFDICYEYSDGSSLYELVAHLPDKANNYLTPALALLEKNT